jgi:hypothetical protein
MIAVTDDGTGRRRLTNRIITTQVTTVFVSRKRIRAAGKHSRLKEKKFMKRRALYIY